MQKAQGLGIQRRSKSELVTTETELARIERSGLIESRHFVTDLGPDGLKAKPKATALRR